MMNSGLLLWNQSPVLGACDFYSPHQHLGAGAGDGGVSGPQGPLQLSLHMQLISGVLVLGQEWALLGRKHCTRGCRSCQVSLVFRSPQHHCLTVPQAGGCVCTPNPSPAGASSCTRLLPSPSTASLRGRNLHRGCPEPPWGHRAGAGCQCPRCCRLQLLRDADKTLRPCRFISWLLASLGMKIL